MEVVTRVYAEAEERGRGTSAEQDVAGTIFCSRAVERCHQEGLAAAYVTDYTLAHEP